MTEAVLFSPLLLLVVVVVLGLLRMEGNLTVGEGDEAATRMVGVIPDDGVDRDVGLDRFFRSIGALSVGIGGFFFFCCCGGEDDNDDRSCCSCCCCCVCVNCCEGG